jgi:hypothetical protein
MKTSEIKIGKQYTAKVTHKLVIIEITSKNPNGGWNARNLSTSKTIHIKSAQRLRGFAKGTNTSPTVGTNQLDSSKSAVTTKTTHTAKPVANKWLSALDAAVRVLAEAAEPMNCRQLIETMRKKNYWQPSRAGKTPTNTLHAAISKEIKTKGTDSRFEKIARGQFALVQ